MEANELVNIAAAAALSKGGEDLIAYDVSGRFPLADAFLIVSGKNERNVDAIASEVERRLYEAGCKKARREGKVTWTLLDFEGVIVHVFLEEERKFYGLERLWKDCPEITLASFPAAS